MQHRCCIFNRICEFCAVFLQRYACYNIFIILEVFHVSIGKNIGYLRKQKQLSQEQLAEQLNVARQSISRWEVDEAIPELAKLVEMCSFFACSLDALVRGDLTKRSEIYTDIRIEKVKALRMASYVMISPNPEEDVIRYMNRWAVNSGLKTSCPNAKLIGWDFPFVSQEQEFRFGMHGYAAAYILPRNFETNCPGVQYLDNAEAFYAVVTITDPFAQPFERIPQAYKIILKYMEDKKIKDKPQDNILSCFEYQYVKNDVSYMDVYVHVNGVNKATTFSQLN